MGVELQHYCRSDRASEASYRQAADIAARLHTHLNEASIRAAIVTANSPRASSAVVQAVFLDYARQLGFVDESRGLFAQYPVSGLRPDYYLPIENTGILLEVERGKTTINNMDLLDFWKCHLCSRANYLFLMVPQELRQNETMAPRREFNTVSKRLATFFEPRNYTNVWGLWLFGY